MVECRSCRALYAVVNIADLNVSPKCHYCRLNESCESVVCVKCENKFCEPTAERRQHRQFVCGVCIEDPAHGTPQREISLAELMELNPGAINCFGVSEKAREHVFGRVGLYKLWMGHKEVLNSVELSCLSSLVVAGKPVHFVADVFDFITTQTLTGRLAETCNLCFEERPLGLLQSSCGACPTLACQDCLRAWYGRLAPGHLYVPCEGLCAFCKRVPKTGTLRTFNRNACRLAGRRTLELRSDWYYGWCRMCFKIAEALPRTCAAVAPELTEFVCEPCKVSEIFKSEQAMKKATKQCPACTAPTIKISGCDHIICPCGTHWCYVCQGKYDRDEIYQHLELEHGGIFGNGDDFSDEE